MTGQATTTGPTFQFGVYQLDTRSGELYKHGRRIRLQEQPFRVLALLVERAGQVVTREELRAVLWPSDVVVDYDHSLNKRSQPRSPWSCCRSSARR